VADSKNSAINSFIAGLNLSRIRFNINLLNNTFNKFVFENSLPKTANSTFLYEKF